MHIQKLTLRHDVCLVVFYPNQVSTEHGQIGDVANQAHGTA